MYTLNHIVSLCLGVQILIVVDQLNSHVFGIVVGTRVTLTKENKDYHAKQAKENC